VAAVSTPPVPVAPPVPLAPPVLVVPPSISPPALDPASPPPPPTLLLQPEAPPVVAARVMAPASPRRVEGRAPEPIDRAPHDAGADRLLREANDLWERGNTTGAYALAREALAAGAGAPGHVLLGALLINMQNYAAAEPELATAVRLDPRNAEARRMLTLLHRISAERQAR
jgi:hypothetical protein